MRPTLDAPGKNSDLTDPGELRLTLNIEGNPFKIDTSLDSISPPENTVAKELKVLTEFIRGAGKPPLCSNVEFFGVKAKVPAE